MTTLPVVIPPQVLRPVVYRALTKKYGLAIKLDGLQELAKYIGSSYGAQWKDEINPFLDTFAAQWRNDTCRGIFVDGVHVRQVLAELLEEVIVQSRSQDGILENHQDLPVEDVWQCINTIQQRRVPYNHWKKQFDSPANTSPPALKQDMFSTRYYITRDRSLRNAASLGAPFEFTEIKNFMGKDSQNFVVLGLLIMNNKGKWALEDPSGSIEIDISQCVPTPLSYYMPGCIVIAEGIYFTVGQTFHVTSMTHPPGEKRVDSQLALGNLDLVRATHLDKQRLIVLHEKEIELDENEIILLGGESMFLDQQNVHDALRKLFAKLEELPPYAIICFGSFFSKPVIPTSSNAIPSTTLYRKGFESLAVILEEFPELVSSTKFVFVPGNNDPWKSMSTLGMDGVLPMAPLPSLVTHKLERVLKQDIVWATNPCRIMYYSQEIFLVRDDLQQRLKVHDVSFPAIASSKDPHSGEEEGQYIDQLVKNPDQLPRELEQARKLVKTVLDQGHISPFVESIRPVDWEQDHTLMLFPAPTTLILCDTTAPKLNLTYNGCKAINPGSLIVNRKLKYSRYFPSTRNCIEEEVLF
ncbi:DNA polymerase epsilon noncatalytic subunit KNAG_0F03890 [Huiozyma naganishii CBS 8797]|uniref:DNA polymerase epsilon subunit n=1 Tax=Huiozyma naganishii (strain ATCC MYA-139 / BCRC 22969 / CBS 8797 / KCTC 17520 / NBRC 10181 / NCYC 3082 / Yp74L-3) TaxID=1071383 RepID=J7RND8_HUIN7|nr:hypothetical protein KNAG_0F03890 [Kazachstania naganishii CBS 8797]CCK71053.1 hypothetical protein KNAG_0F03890 [Kazachstania naganishii CBS 8797]